MKMLHSLLWTALLLSLAACNDAPSPPAIAPAAPPEPTSPTAAPPTAAPTTPVRARMQDHFRFARAARTGLIRGDVAETKNAMAELARVQSIEGLPTELEPMLPAMRDAASQVASAHTLREVGAGLANTLVTCAGCHQHVETGPHFATPPLPEGDTVQVHMQRHRWAADRLWEGLVQPSDEDWNAGADALSNSRLDPAELQIPDAQRATAATLIQHVYDLGEQAKSAATPDARAAIYGQFIATCATCHRLVHGGPDAEAANQ